MVLELQKQRGFYLLTFSCCTLLKESQHLGTRLKYAPVVQSLLSALFPW